MKRANYHKAILHIVVICCLAIFTHCQRLTPEKIIKKTIELHLRSTLKEDDQYTPMLYGKLDPDSTSIKQDPEYKHYKNLAFMSSVLSQSYSKTGYENPEKLKLYADTALYYKKICDSLEAKFIPKHIGWKMQHIYQTIDAKYNKPVVNNSIFHFDLKIKNMSVEQVYKNLQLETYNLDKKFYGLGYDYYE